MNDPMGIAADIRFGVHSRLASLAAHIDKCVTDYALGGLYPVDGDYDHIMKELGTVRDQIRTFVKTKEVCMKFTTTKGG